MLHSFADYTLRLSVRVCVGCIPRRDAPQAAFSKGRACDSQANGLTRYLRFNEKTVHLLLIDNPFGPVVAANRRSAEDRNGYTEAALTQLPILDLGGCQIDGKVIPWGISVELSLYRHLRLWRNNLSADQDIRLARCARIESSRTDLGASGKRRAHKYLQIGHHPVT
jgi:hypothetical protein